MELKYLYVYNNMEQYIEHLDEKDAWEKIMIQPYWQQIAEWAPFPIDDRKPKPILDRQILLNQLQQAKKVDLAKLAPQFKKIISVLPKDDDDPMTIAFYPSDNGMVEGVFGTGTWGNMIININFVNQNAMDWIPFVFAHEYHHNVLGFYWYCVNEGKFTKGNLLEQIINEGEADAFAQSIYPSLYPSWHQGVQADKEYDVWEKMKSMLYKVAPAEEFGPYIFGDEKLRIPPYAGYYFGQAIVKDYLKKHPDIDFAELIKVPHQTIFDESRFALHM